jgi:hypothetical protein
MSVVLSLPKKFLSTPEGSLSEGVSSQSIKVQPNNVSSITSNNISSLTASTITTQPPMVVQDIRFSIPTGMGKNVWCDTSKSTLSFRATYKCSTASTTGGIQTGYLQSNALSFFDRLQVLNSNGVAIDDVVGLAQIEHHKQTWACDVAERDSIAMSYGYGFEDEATDSINRNQGHVISSFSTATAVVLPVANSYYSYDVPLPSSFLGTGAKGFVPIGALQKLDVVLTTNNFLPIVIDVGAGMTASPTLSVVLDNFAINLHYVYLDDKSASLLGSPKTHYLHGITNRSSSATINSGLAGQASILMGLRGQSVRGIATRFSDSALTTTGSINGIFDSKACLSSQINYFLNGSQRVPQNPLSVNTAPASVFTQALFASEAFTQKEFRYSGVPNSFATYWATSTAPTAANGYDQYLVNAGSSSQANAIQNFCFAQDLRKCSTSAILDGANLSAGANNYLELNITNAPSANVYTTFIASLDIIYMIDMEAGTVDFRM